jgi:hypothetical protein
MTIHSRIVLGFKLILLLNIDENQRIVKKIMRGKGHDSRFSAKKVSENPGSGKVAWR